LAKDVGPRAANLCVSPSLGGWTVLSTHVVTLLVKLRRYLTRNTLLILAAATLLVVLLGGALVYHAEYRTNPGLTTLGDAIWYAVVTVTTVGYGDRAPETPTGRAVGVGLMLFGIGFLGLFTATIASLFIDRMLREGRGLTPVQATGHIVICGWNDKGRLIVGELREETDRPVVILADLAERPMEGAHLSFVRGRPYLEESLHRVDIMRASGAVVLADESEGEPSDAKTVLTVLAVESLNPAVYTCVEVLERQNIEHLRRAGADEILPTTELVGSLLARASLHPGLISAISELSTSSIGAEIYVIEAPPALHGMRFDEAIGKLRAAPHGSILIGVRVDGQVKLCPPGDWVIERGQQLFVVAMDKPEV